MNEEINTCQEVDSIIRRDFGLELSQAQEEEVARANAESAIGTGCGVTFILVNALHLLSREEMEDPCPKDCREVRGEVCAGWGNGRLNLDSQLLKYAIL